jgi:hypothetical protein
VHIKNVAAFGRCEFVYLAELPVNCEVKANLCGFNAFDRSARICKVRLTVSIENQQRKSKRKKYRSYCEKNFEAFQDRTPSAT